MSSRIKEIRESLVKAKGPYFEAARVAERIGVSRMTLHRWETGATMPSAELAARLAQDLGVTVEQLGIRRNIV